MIDILQTIATAASDLTAGQSWDTNAGHSAAIVYHQHVMPARSNTEAADVMPFCLVKAREFILFPGRRQTIELVYCLYNDSRTDAMSDMDRLTDLLEPLARRGQNLGGWKVAEITGYAGDKDTGVQPHPEYYLTVAISLIAPPVQ